MRSNEKHYEEEAKLKNKISYNIKMYRKKRHLTQEELAEEAQISYDFMRRIESQNCGFSVITLYKIAVALNVSVDVLMDRNIEELIKNL